MFRYLGYAYETSFATPTPSNDGTLAVEQFMTTEAEAPLLRDVVAGLAWSH